MREAKRQNQAYRQFAVPCLGQFAKARKDVDARVSVLDTVKPILDKELQEAAHALDAMEVDGKSTADETRL